MREYNPFEERNVQFLVNKRIDYATIQITQTGINKSTLDATAPVRSFLRNTAYTIMSTSRKDQPTRCSRRLTS